MPLTNFPSATKLSEIIGSILDAAAEPNSWPAVLTRLAALFGSARAHLAVFNPSTMQATELGAGGDATWASVFDQRVALRARMLARDILPRGGAPGAQAAHLRTECQDDLLCPASMTLCLASIRTRRPAHAAVLALWRPIQHGRWQRAQVDLLALLSPHVARALEHQLEVTERNWERHAFTDTLDQFQHGILLVSDDGGLLFVNRAAQAMVADSDGFLVLGAALRAAQPTQNAAFQCLLANALGHNGVPQPTSGVMTISRGSGREHLVVRVMPLRSSLGVASGERRAALILIVDPAQETHLSALHLRQLYGLTSAEAAVAVRVFRGRGLQSVADELHVTLSTVRVQLQRVFEKTHTHRQAELVRLLLQVHGQCGVAEATPATEQEVAPRTLRHSPSARLV